jgi:hypothetical protein
MVVAPMLSNVLRVSETSPGVARGMRPYAAHRDRVPGVLTAAYEDDL